MAAKLNYNKWDSIASKRLVATSNQDREFLLRLIASDKDIDLEKIKEHADIDDDFLKESIDILKDSGLISNNVFFPEPEVEHRVFNITKQGKSWLNQFSSKKN